MFEYRLRRHLLCRNRITLTCYGSRGCGKTTFLRNVKDLIRTYGGQVLRSAENDNGTETLIADWGGIIFPRLIEEIAHAYRQTADLNRRLQALGAASTNPVRAEDQ